MRMRCEESDVCLHDNKQMKGPRMGSIMSVWS